jgi:ABC-type nitrate/sulfonate/bicarbonate transport system permease component
MTLEEQPLQPRRRRGWRLTNRYITLASLAVILIVWETLGRQLPAALASYPSAIAQAFWQLLMDGELASAFITSIQPFIAGYLLSALIGIPLGLLLGRDRTVEAALGVYVTAGYAVPLVALVPLFVLWFGLGFLVKVVIIFTMAVFPIIINTWAGVQAVPSALVEVGTAFVASPAAIMRKIIVPATIPHVMTGLRLAIGRAVVGMVVAEFFTAIGGLGGIVIRAGNNYDMAVLFVPIIVLMLLGYGLTVLVGKLERRIAPWQSGITGQDRWRSALREEER